MHCAVGIFRKFEGVVGQAGNRRRGLHPDLDETLDAQAASGPFGEQQVLGLDPTHRAGELPGQQFDNHPAAHLVGTLGDPGVVIGEDLIKWLGGNQIADLLDEVAIQAEQPGYQIGDVAADKRTGIGTVRHDPFQRATELVDAHAQHVGVERHVDAGNHNESPLAAGDLQASGDLGFESLQSTHRTGDRVLRAAQVEVDDLQEFAGACGDFGDESLDVSVIEVHLRRTDCRQSVIGTALLITRHDVVHLAAAVEHHLEEALKFVDPGDARQRGVLTDRMPTGNGALDEGTLLAHLGDLGGRHRRHGNLGELRQVQHTVGMLIVHTGGNEAGWIVTHHMQHREAQGCPGELVGAVPHLACGLGPSAHLHAHALVLDTLSGECVSRFGGSKPGCCRHDELALDFSADLQNLCAQVDSDPIHPEVDLVTRFDHAQEPGGPPHQLAGGDGLTVRGGHDVLGGGR